MSDDYSHYLPGVDALHKLMGYADYQQVLGFIDGLPISEESKEELRDRFPQPGCNDPAPLVTEEDEEGTLWYPPDTGPLADYHDHGWLDGDPLDEPGLPSMEEYRKSPLYKMVRRNMQKQINEDRVLDDILENTLHVLGRCNEPANWGKDRRGLVYGMIQSGKTANMINLIASGMDAGYSLFIVLAGDKSSLRDQSQDRVNKAFELTNGINEAHRVHSSTHARDFDDRDGVTFKSAFMTAARLRGREYRNVIVIKKNIFLLRKLIAAIGDLRQWCSDQAHRGFEFSDDYRCLIIDDEADYASQDTDATGEEGSPIHSTLVDLRLIDGFRNCYAAYTATPQACLSGSTSDVIGYPRHFFWVLEPYMEREDEDSPYRTKTYLGAFELFNELDHLLVQDIDRDEWPHHVRDMRGDYEGVWVPDYSPPHQDGGLKDVEASFLDRILRDTPLRDYPDSLRMALHNHIITCGVRWYRYWRRHRQPGDGIPSVQDVSEDYPHHATMIHLSRLTEHQKQCRDVVKMAWIDALSEWEGINPESSEDGGDISRLWKEQQFRSRKIPKTPSTLVFGEVLPFMRMAIDITSVPIRRMDPTNNYPFYRHDDDSKYPGDPVCFYLINSSSEGMKLYYSKDKYPDKVRTKKAAVFIGGDILSRGLTIEGLSVTYFGRSAGKEMGDTVLQRGRWFGHKKDYADLIQVYLQPQAQLVFRQISIADRDLRMQMKQAIRRGLGPMEILLCLRNSPWFRSCSPAKSTFLTQNSSVSFSGSRAILKEPTFEKGAILRNNELLSDFEDEHAGLRDEDKAHGRAWVYRGVPLSDVVSFLRSLDCKRDAWKASPEVYAEFLEEWRDDENVSDPPPINIAVMDNRRMSRKRVLGNPKAPTPEEARRGATSRIGSIIGGSAHGTYKGDYFLDKDKEWHENATRADTKDKARMPGDPILIVLYGLRPNYLTKYLFDSDDPDSPLGAFRHVPDVLLEDGDNYYVPHEDTEDDELRHSVLVFAAFTPYGGPMYDVGTNSMVSAEGRVRAEEEDEAEED